MYNKWVDAREGFKPIGLGEGMKLEKEGGNDTRRHPPTTVDPLASSLSPSADIGAAAGRGADLSVHLTTAVYVEFEGRIYLLTPSLKHDRVI